MPSTPCRVPTHRDARRTCTKAHPHESGRGTRRVIREGGGKFTAELLPRTTSVVPRTTSVVEWAGKPEKNAPTNGVVAAWKATLHGERHSESRYPGPRSEE